MKKRGFTLAEVLISLGIIGVVSAITMPALTANYQKKTYESQAKKAYNTLSVAIQTYMANEGVDDLTDSGLMSGQILDTLGVDNNTGSNVDVNKKHETALTNFANNYFKVSQICGYSAMNSPALDGDNKNYCFAEKYKTLDRSRIIYMNSLFFSNISTANPYDGDYAGLVFNLVDGSSFSIATPIEYKSDNEEAGTFKVYGALSGRKDVAMSVIIDTNGINGPNISGRDLFIAHVKSDGLVYDLNWKKTDSSNPDDWYAKYKAKTEPIGIGKLMADGWQMLY